VAIDRRLELQQQCKRVPWLQNEKAYGGETICQVHFGYELQIAGN